MSQNISVIINNLVGINLADNVDTKHRLIDLFNKIYKVYLFFSYDVTRKITYGYNFY